MTSLKYTFMSLQPCSVIRLKREQAMYLTRMRPSRAGLALLVPDIVKGVVMLGQGLF